MKKIRRHVRYLNYVEHWLILVSIEIFVDITSSAVGIKIFAITAGIKRYKSVIKKKKKKHDKIVLLKTIC